MPAARKSVSRVPARRPARARKSLAVTAAAAPARVLAAPKAAEAPKPDKPRKLKVLRDSFTIPKSEYEVLDALKQRAARVGRPAKKSEVLRAGLKVLAAMGDVAFMAALGAVPPLKPVRAARS